MSLFNRILGRAEADLSKILSRFTALKSDLEAHIEHHSNLIEDAQLAIKDAHALYAKEMVHIAEIRNEAISEASDVYADSVKTIDKAKTILKNVEAFIGDHI